MASTPTGHGYWLVAADGGVFSFGDATYRGSAVGRPEATVEVSARGNGSYELTLDDGVVLGFGPMGGPTVVARLAAPASWTAERRAQWTAAQAVAVALAQLGKPYRWGASGPAAFDCSGLTLFSYSAAGVSLPRTAAEQYDTLPHIPAGAARPGDLVFFGFGPSHVGIYLGGDRMVDAPYSGTSVRVDPVGGDVDGFARVG
jgi:cell wall-associated NlpC family hydrolase